MMAEALAALLGVFNVLRPGLTAPSFANALVVFSGWVLTHGRHAVTGALIATDVARRVHHESYHRFFSRGTWAPDDLGRLLFERLVKLVPPTSPVQVAIDDTLATKKGPEVFGMGSHLDAVRSTKRFRVFAFGHVWVTLAVIIIVPFSKRPWALPVLFRLYRNEKTCTAKGAPHRKKTELAREMLDTFLSWTDQRRVYVAMDSAYCNSTVMKNLAPFVTVFGSMRPDAVLTTPPKPRGKTRRPGRPRVRGTQVPKPEALARSERTPWQRCRVVLYGKLRTVHFKSLRAQWYRTSGTQLLHIVLVRVERGSIPVRVFFSTDSQLPVAAVLQGYALRWSIEVCFRDLKQLLGFADSSARKREAVERTAPFVGYIYTALVIWFAEGSCRSPLAIPPIRPWYPHKQGLCFADVLRAAQRALAPLDVLDPARSLDNLQRCSPGSKKAASTARTKAA